MKEKALTCKKPWVWWKVLPGLRETGEPPTRRLSAALGMDEQISGLWLKSDYDGKYFGWIHA